MTRSGSLWFGTAGYAVCLSFYQLDNLVHRAGKSIGVLASGCGEMCLATAAALDELACLAHHLACVLTFGHQIVAEAHGKAGLSIGMATQYHSKALGILGTQMSSRPYLIQKIR